MGFDHSYIKFLTNANKTNFDKGSNQNNDIKNVN